MSSWQPNPNAKPFTPASAYFTLPIPCKNIRIRKKGIFSRIIQWILVIVLCVTVVINFVFIWDTTMKYSRDRNGLSANTADVKLSQLERNEKTGMVCKANFILTSHNIILKERLYICGNNGRQCFKDRFFKIMKKLWKILRPHKQEFVKVFKQLWIFLWYLSIYTWIYISHKMYV